MQSAAGVDPHAREAEAIEGVLERLQAAAPSSFSLVEELVRRLGAIYAGAFDRMLAHARAAGADGEALARRIANDELVASLLALHGLHPVPLQERVEQAIDRVRPQFQSSGVELVGVDAHGVVTLRLRGGSAFGRGAIARTLRAAIEAAAPEVCDVRLLDARALPVVR